MCIHIYYKHVNKLVCVVYSIVPYSVNICSDIQLYLKLRNVWRGRKIKSWVRDRD